MQPDPKVAIVIPAYNEEKTIGAVLAGVKGYAHVIVVNDGSSDKTAQIAEKAGALVVTHSPNQGYDGAIRSGLLKAIELGTDIAVTLDADGQHNPQNIDTVLKEMARSQAACVIGIRPTRARISEHIFCAYTKLRFGISDILCGLKAYKLSILKDHTNVLHVKSAGAAGALAIARAGHKISECPIEIKDREDEARIGNVFKANIYILSAMFRVMRVSQKA